MARAGRQEAIRSWHIRHRQQLARNTGLRPIGWRQAPISFLAVGKPACAHHGICRSSRKSTRGRRKWGTRRLRHRPVQIVQRLLSTSALSLDCIELSLHVLQSAHVCVCHSHVRSTREDSFGAPVGRRGLPPLLVMFPAPTRCRWYCSARVLSKTNRLSEYLGDVQQQQWQSTKREREREKEYTMWHEKE